MAGHTIAVSSRKRIYAEGSYVQNRRIFKAVQNQHPDAAPLRRDRPAGAGGDRSLDRLPPVRGGPADDRQPDHRPAGPGVLPGRDGRAAGLLGGPDRHGDAPAGPAGSGGGLHSGGIGPAAASGHNHRTAEKG